VKLVVSAQNRWKKTVLGFSMCHQKLAAIAFGGILNVAATRLSHRFCALTINLLHGTGSIDYIRNLNRQEE